MALTTLFLVLSLVAGPAAAVRAAGVDWRASRNMVRRSDKDVHLYFEHVAAGGSGDRLATIDNAGAGTGAGGDAPIYGRRRYGPRRSPDTPPAQPNGGNSDGRERDFVDWRTGNAGAHPGAGAGAGAGAGDDPIWFGGALGPGHRPLAPRRYFY